MLPFFLIKPKYHPPSRETALLCVCVCVCVRSVPDSNIGFMKAGAKLLAMARNQVSLFLPRPSLGKQNKESSYVAAGNSSTSTLIFSDKLIPVILVCVYGQRM